ncbi:hypothetical protein HUJ05_006422 [Dendroctonus ponderosae]|nr:hypothetical protein HUJ05_006422 [Dendroctonus ponderosae]
MEPESYDSKEQPHLTIPVPKKERKFTALDLTDQSLTTNPQPVLVVQSPKTPTLSRKLKAVSLDSEPQPQSNTLEVFRDVFSMPNTPKKQIKQKLSCDFNDGPPKSTLAPSFSSNLKKFASNNSISGSQTLKTLPEVNALQDFSDCPNPEPQKVRTKGLLERRGSNASLTIDLGSTQNIGEVKPVPFNRLNTAKSVSNLYLSSLAGGDNCACVKRAVEVTTKVSNERRKSQEACGNCTIYESELKMSTCKARCQNLKRCHGCPKSRRKSLSNENLYVPPCGFCELESKECAELRTCKGSNRKAVFPRQPDLDSSQLLSDDFKLHLQNIQYLQTAGKPMSVEELRQSCDVKTREPLQMTRIPKMQQEFWEVPLNLQEKCYVSGSQSKNRYRGVLPNEHSRVLLPNSGGYIHANYIKGPDYTETAYIATQGPLQHTCIDFWEMVWHSQCKCIVMLTGLVEKARNKCELYFPLGKKSSLKEKTFFYVKTSKVRDKFTFDCSSNSNGFDVETYEFEEKNEVIFGKYRITYVKQRELDDCQIRQLQLRKTDLNVEPRVIFHYWLANWPDHQKTSSEQVLKTAVDVLDCLDGIKVDISESLSTKSKEHEVQHFDLKGPESPDKNTDAECSSNETNYSSNPSQSRDTGKPNFSFDLFSSENGTTVAHNVTTECHKETQSATTFTFTVNCNSINQHFTSESMQCEGAQSNCAFSFSEVKMSDSESTFQESVGAKQRERSKIASKQMKTKKSSVSDFNKEVLTNRCSLDSKLQHLNKMADFKSHFKPDVCMKALKTKHVGFERKRSAENIRLPLICHCSAGIGRTGCFLAILNGIQQLRMNNSVDVLAILCSLRLNRGGMVQTAEQYELIHRVLSLYSKSM